jgi:hypothetical protein
MAHAVCTVVLLLIATAAVHAAEGTVGTETATANESKDRAERARRVLSMPPRGGELIGSTTIDISDLGELGAVVAFAIRQQPSAMVRLSVEDLFKAETDGGSLPANADAILKFVVRDNTTANVEMQPLPKQLRRFYVAFSPWASVGMQEWMIWRSPRTPPISANALNYTQIGGWRERFRRWARTSSRPQMVVALFRERVFKTAVGARVELPATPGRGTFTIGLQNVSFGVTFALVVNEQPQKADAVVKRRGGRAPSASTLPVVSWVVTRAAVTVPDFAAAVYSVEGAMLGSAVVRVPSPRGVTLTDIFSSLPKEKLSVRRDAVEENATTSTRKLAGAKTMTADALKRTLYYSPGDKPATSRTVAETIHFHLAVEYHESYREHFGELRLAEVRDQIVDVLSESRGAEMVFKVALAPRYAVMWSPRGVTDVLLPTPSDDVEAFVKFTMDSGSETGGERAINLRAVHLTLLTSQPASDVQIIVQDGDGTVLFSADDHSFGAEGQIIAERPRDDEETLGQARFWRGALTIPPHGWANDSLAITVRFNALESSESTSVDAAPDLLGALRAAGAWLGEVAVTGGRPGGKRLSLRALKPNAPASIVYVSHPDACLSVTDVHTASETLQAILTSLDWAAFLKKRGLPLQPHTSLVALATGLQTAAAFGGARRGAAAKATSDRLYKSLLGLRSAHMDEMPMMWPREQLELLFGLPRDDSESAESATSVGMELKAALEQFEAEFQFLLRTTNFTAAARGDYFYYRALVGMHVRAMGRSQSDAIFTFEPLLGLFAHDDFDPSVSDHLHGFSQSEQAQFWRAAATAKVSKDPALVLATRRAVAIDEELSLDRSGAGVLMDAEVFGRFGVVVRREGSMTASVQGIRVRANHGSLQLLRRQLGHGGELASLSAVTERLTHTLTQREQRFTLLEGLAQQPDNTVERTRRLRLALRLLDNELRVLRMLAEDADDQRRAGEL